MKSFITYSILIIFIILLSGCKKYPENTLWFKNPEKICPISGNITEYKVNGIDSLNLLNVYYEQAILHGYGPYNNTIRDVKQEVFNPSNKGKGKFNLQCDIFASNSGTCTWNSNKKSVNVRVGIDMEYFKRNIFITQGLNWDIQYLDTKGKSKIKTTYNGNTYEITFVN